MSFFETSAYTGENLTYALEFFINRVFLRKLSKDNLILLHRINNEKRPYKIDENGTPVTIDNKLIEKLCLTNPLKEAINDAESYSSVNKMERTTRAASIEARELRFSLAKPKLGGGGAEESAGMFNDVKSERS